MNAQLICACEIRFLPHPIAVDWGVQKASNFIFHHEAPARPPSAGGSGPAGSPPGPTSGGPGGPQLCKVFIRRNQQVWIGLVSSICGRQAEGKARVKYSSRTPFLVT